MKGNGVVAKLLLLVSVYEFPWLNGRYWGAMQTFIYFYSKGPNRMYWNSSEHKPWYQEVSYQWGCHW